MAAEIITTLPCQSSRGRFSENNTNTLAVSNEKKHHCDRANCPTANAKTSTTSNASTLSVGLMLKMLLLMLSAN